jgi:hypothetical protein
MKIVIGNHETEIPTILNQIIDDFEIDYFGVGGQYYYSFDYRNVHFIVMSDFAPNSSEESLQTYKEGSKQYNFVKNDLAKSSADPQIDWIIVSHHIQQYASSENEVIHTVDEWPRIYHPLFTMYNVDLVLQGHQHNYQRTYPIKYNVENPEMPIITDGSKNSYTSMTGQIFVTAGTAGASLQDLVGIAPYIVTEHVGYGFIDISLIDDGATLNAKFYDNDGTVKDEFTITK